MTTTIETRVMRKISHGFRDPLGFAPFTAIVALVVLILLEVVCVPVEKGMTEPPVIAPEPVLGDMLGPGSEAVLVPLGYMLGPGSQAVLIPLGHMLGPGSQAVLVSLGNALGPGSEVVLVPLNIMLDPVLADVLLLRVIPDGNHK